MRRIIWWLAFVGSRDEDNRVVLGDILRRRVQGVGLRRKTISQSVIRQSASKGFTGSGIASEKDVHGFQFTTRRSCLGLSLPINASILGRIRCATQSLTEMRGIQTLAKRCSDLEVLGLDGKGLLDPQIVTRVIHLEIEVLQQHRNDK